MSDYDKIDIAPEILEAAAKWHTRLNSGDASDKDIEHHMDWLLADPVHADAYEHVAATLRDASQFEQAARAAFASDLEVAPKPGPTAARPMPWTGWSWPQWAVTAAVAASLLFAAIIPGSGLLESPVTRQFYAANDDTVERVSLADGSTIVLLAGSRVTAAFTDDERSIVLERGRAFFDVTSNPARPFRVTVGTRHVTVVGTRFEVLLGNGFEQVSVNEGLVTVSTIAGAQTSNQPTIQIKPGMVATYTADVAKPMVTETPAASIGNWSNGVLVFNNALLPEVIEGIKKLFPTTDIRLEDSSMNTLIFSGTLAVSNPEKMARQLADFLKLKVTVSDEKILLMPE